MMPRMYVMQNCVGSLSLLCRCLRLGGIFWAVQLWCALRAKCFRPIYQEKQLIRTTWLTDWLTDRLIDLSDCLIDILFLITHFAYATHGATVVTPCKIPQHNLPLCECRRPGDTLGAVQLWCAFWAKINRFDYLIDFMYLLTLTNLAIMSVHHHTCSTFNFIFMFYCFNSSFCSSLLRYRPRFFGAIFEANGFRGRAEKRGIWGLGEDAEEEVCTRGSS